MAERAKDQGRVSQHSSAPSFIPSFIHSYNMYLVQGSGTSSPGWIPEISCFGSTHNQEQGTARTIHYGVTKHGSGLVMGCCIDCGHRCHTGSEEPALIGMSTTRRTKSREVSAPSFRLGTKAVCRPNGLRLRPNAESQGH